MSEYSRDVSYFTWYYTDSAKDVPVPNFANLCILYFIISGRVFVFDEMPSNVTPATTLHISGFLHAFHIAFTIAASSWYPLSSAEDTTLKHCSKSLYTTNNIEQYEE